MNKVTEIFKKILMILKKTWWLILFVAGLLIGISFKKSKRILVTNAKKENLEKKQQELEKDLERLKKEAEEREKANRFDNPDDASDYLNDVLRRIQDNSKK